MQVPMSSYLVEIKPQIQELIRLLEREFDYVSVLCTDVKGTTYRVSMHQTSVSDYHFCERGFVVRAWQDGSYTEYSFNNLTDAADLAEEITSAEIRISGIKGTRHCADGVSSRAGRSHHQNDAE